MKVRKVVAGSVLAAGVGVMGVVGAGTASATNDNWTPGHGGWQPGAALATFSSNAKVASGNFNGATGVQVGDIKILSGNTVTLKALNGNKVLSGNSFLNGNFSNNIFNSGANSFNTTTIKDSYNTEIKESYNKTTTPKKDDKPHGGGWGPSGH